MVRAITAAFFLLFSLSLFLIQAQAIAPRVSVLPSSPEAGGTFTLTVQVEGLQAGGLEVRQPPEPRGIALLSRTIRPRIYPGGSGVEVKLEYRADVAGTWILGPFVLEAKGIRAIAPAIDVAVRPVGGGEAAPQWNWVVPPRVMRWASIPVGLRPAAGDTPTSASASVANPPGAILDQKDRLSWILTALEGGEAILPRVVVALGKGREPGISSAQLVEVTDPPAEIATTRAMGDFRLSLEGRATSDGRALIRVILRGTGNFPFLRPPQAVISFEGIELPRASRRERRLEDWNLSPQGYEGGLVVETECILPSTGRLVASLPEWPFLSSQEGVSTLSVLPVTLEISSRASPQGKAPAAGKAGPFGELSVLASRESAGIPEPVRRSYLEASRIWSTGKKGEALATLYSALRRSPSEEVLWKAARACTEELGSGSPLLDLLPHPLWFSAAALILLVGAGASLVVWRRGRRKEFFIPGLLILAASILALAFAMAAGLERGDTYAVIWSDRILLVPSPAAEGSVSLQRGSTARVIGSAPGYVGLRLADGLAGWALREEVYFY